jgi:hypothetical protein
MLTLNNTHFVACDTDVSRPELKNLCLSAARFGIHFRILRSYNGIDPQEVFGLRADYMAFKIRTAFYKLDVPPDDFVFFSDANDVILNKGWDAIKPLLEKYYQPGKIANLRRNGRITLHYPIDDILISKLNALSKTLPWFAQYPTGNFFGKWKDMKELFGDMIYFADRIIDRTLDAAEMQNRFHIPPDITELVLLPKNLSIAYDDESNLVFVNNNRIVPMRYNELVSWKFANQNSPIIHYCGSYGMKISLGGRFNVFTQPEQPVPFARCRYFQLEFPRKKYNEKLPCRGDLGHCTYVGNLPRGVNWCNPKNCIQYVPLKIDILGASSTTEKMPECKK